MFDFSSVETVDPSEAQPSSSTSKWLNKPGYYLGKLKDITYGVSSAKQTPYMAMVFDTSHGEFTEKVYITKESLKRVKFIFLQYTNTNMDQKFNSVTEIVDFFKTALLRLNKTVGLVVRGDLVGDKFYPKGDYYFITPQSDTFKEKVIEIGSPEFMDLVNAKRIGVRDAVLPPNDNAIVNQKPAEAPKAETATSGFLPVADDDNDLPF